MKISRLFAFAVSVIAAFVFLLPSAANAYPIQAGIAHVGPNYEGCTSGVVSFQVDFDYPFETTPIVVVTPENNFDYPVDDTFAVTIKGQFISPYGFEANVTRVEGGSKCWDQDLLADWIAIGVEYPYQNDLFEKKTVSSDRFNDRY